MDVDELIARVRSRTGATRLEARRAVSATLSTLALCLDESVQKALGEQTAGLVALDASPHELHDLDEGALEAEVGRRVRTTPSKGVELTEVVLEVLAELLPDELLLRMRKQVDPSVRVRLVPRGPSPEPPPHVRHHPPIRWSRGPTLSTGHPGYEQPLAEARSPGAQTGSVASPSPHGDTKVSSAHGTTQEQDDRTLAESTGLR